MSPDKVTKFGPGQEFRLDKRVIFVEYESMTGEFVKCRFDLSQKTEMIYNDHRILSFDALTYLYSTDEELFIKKVLYYEQECHMVIGGKLLIPTKVYFENAGYQQAYETNNKLLRNVANSAYGIVSRDWADVLADSARYIHMQQSRCNGKTLWLSSATSFDDKQPLWSIDRYHDICEQWLKEPPTPCEFISDDLEDCEKGVPNTKLMDTAQLISLLRESSTTKPMRFRGKTWTHPESSYGKKGHMLIVDINSKASLHDDACVDVEVGDVMWYDDGNNGKNESDDHGKLFVWQGLGIGWKKLSDDNGYFDTDMAVEENAAEKLIEICKKVKEEKKVAAFDFYKPKIHKVIFNDPATIVFWSDGSKTIVKCRENDDFDPEKGIAMCCMKRLLGTNETGSNYLDQVKEYIRQWREDQEEGDVINSTVIKAILNAIHLPAPDVNTGAMDIPPEESIEKEFEAVTSSDWTVAPADENTTAEEDGE